MAVTTDVFVGDVGVELLAAVTMAQRLGIALRTYAKNYLGRDPNGTRAQRFVVLSILGKWEELRDEFVVEIADMERVINIRLEAALGGKF